MSKILRRPMFRGGPVDSRGTGITSGLMDGGRVGYNMGGGQFKTGTQIVEAQEKKEEFMNELQQEYFRQKLLKWRDELLNEASETRNNLQEDSLGQPDIADRASAETDRSLELRTRDRARKLISKIDEALERLENGSYGFCEETDEPIGLKRLEARPIATLSVEAQERHERMERTRRDD